MKIIGNASLALSWHGQRQIPYSAVQITSKTSVSCCIRGIELHVNKCRPDDH